MGKARSRETPQALNAEEAPGPPAESEDQERVSTSRFNRAKLKRVSQIEKLFLIRSGFRRKGNR